MQSALESVEGVEGVEVNFATNTATVTGSNLNTQALVRAFEGTRFSGQLNE